MSEAAHIRVVRVEGGCQRVNDCVARIGSAEFHRSPGEPVAAFEGRVVASAEAAGAELVVFGSIDPVPGWRAAEEAESIESAEAAADRLADDILTGIDAPHVRLHVALRGWLRWARASGAFTPSERHREALRRLPPEADFIQGLSQSLIGGDYDGVTIALNDNVVTVFDDADAGTDTAPPTKAIAFQDLIGQPTWLQPLLISVKTVLRADIHLGDIVSLPPTIVSVSGAALPGYGDNNPARDNVSFGGGTYLVVDVHHFGNSRGPMADAWNTTFQMTPA